MVPAMLRSLCRLLLLSGCLSAQWLDYPSKGIPRTPNGKPDLKAPAPKLAGGLPDLSGIWIRTRPAGAPPGPEFGNTVDYYMPEGAKVPFQPWAQELFNQRRYRDLGANRPSEHCLPHGIVGGLLPAVPFKFIQTPDLTIQLYEQLNHYRQIFMDGRPQPEDPNPTWYGYAVGHYEGDQLVVETKGFNDKTWLDDSGTPNTEMMRTVERFRRVDFGHMNLEVTMDDPKAYTKPWTMLISLQLMADTELIEDVCENEKDAAHQVPGR